MLLRLSLLSLLLANVALAIRMVPRQAFPDPTVDPFYKAPKNLRHYSPGEVIRHRLVNTTIPANVKQAYQVLYRTTDTQGNPESTVATLFKPTKPGKKAQVLSYHVYMDSDVEDCDPAWAFDAGSASKATGTTTTDSAIFINWALNNGIYVVVPDDEGPQAAFIAGFQEGMAALDGMRAIKNFFSFPKKTEIVITGYSGGAHVTAWAANLAHKYAPDLNIVGDAHGGTPIDTNATFTLLNKSLFAGFAGAGLVGQMNAYPSLNKYVLANYNDTGKKFIDLYRTNNECEGNVSTSAPGVDFLSFFTNKNPLNQKIPQQVFARESLLMNVSSVGVAVPKFPRYVFHGLVDEIVPYPTDKLYVEQQCKKGANIAFVTYPNAEHILAEYEGLLGAINFARQAFAGKTPKVKCGSPVPNPLSLADPRVATLLGNQTYAAIKAFNGTTPTGLPSPIVVP